MSKRKIINRIISVALTFLILVGAQIRCYDKVGEVVRQSTIDKYGESIKRQAVDVEKNFLEIFRYLDTTSRVVKKKIENDFDPFNIVNSINKIDVTLGNQKGIYIDSKGMAYTTARESYSLKNNVLYKQSLEGDEFYSDPFYMTPEEKAILFCKPILNDDNEVIASIGLLFPTYKLDNFLSKKNQSKDSYTFLVNRQGEVFSSTGRNGIDNVFNFFSGRELQDKELLSQMLDYKESSCTISDESGDLISVDAVRNTESTGSNVYVVTIVPRETIRKIEAAATTHVGRMLFVSFTLLGLLITYFFHIIFKKNKQDKALLEEMAYTDLETGGRNFQYFNTQVEKGKYTSGYIVALDVKKFSNVEDLYSPEEVKKVITDLWTIISDTLPYGAILAHDQRDQFGLYISTGSKTELENVLANINKALLDYSNKNNLPELQLRFGIIDFDPNEVVSSLYAYAKNCARDKKSGLETNYRYVEKQEDINRERNEMLVSNFHNFIENKQFYFEYQPKFDNQSGKVIGAEVFSRLKLEDGTILYPNQFISVFEEAGYIGELDYYVFTSIVDLLASFKNKNSNVVPISMNTSKYSLYQNDIVNKLLSYVKTKNVDPSLIAFEIGDDNLKGETKLLQVFDRLRKAGFELHIDKFGANSSSLLSLSQIDFDVVKLDKSLVDKIGDYKNEYVLRHIISLAADLKIKVIAFGVENQKQANFIKNLGVSSIQGPYYSEPLDVEDFSLVLNQYSDSYLKGIEKFEVLSRSDLLSAFASPIFSNNTISNMTGPIIELGLKDDELYLIGCNQIASVFLSFNLDDLSKSNDFRNIKELTYDEDYKLLRKTINKVVETKDFHECSLTILKNDRPLYVDCRIFYKSQIHGYKEVYVFLRNSQEKVMGDEIINQIPGGLLAYKPNDNQIITSVNDELLRIVGCKDRSEFMELTDNRFSGFVYEQDYRVVTNALYIQLFSSENKEANVKFRIKKKDGKIIYVDLNARYNVDNITDDLIYCYIKSLEGQNEYVLAEETKVAKLQYESTHDGLTGLVNQASVKDLTQEIFDNNPDTEFALFVMDIDDFKQVNDKYGHSFGDTIIKTFASSLRSCVSRPGLCGRIGGDEFIALEPLVKENIYQAAERYYKNLHFALGECVISPSIGITTTKISGRSYREMFLNADIALYGSKNKGKDTYTIFEPNNANDSYKKETTRKDTFNSSRIVETIEKIAGIQDTYLFLVDLRADKVHFTNNNLKKFNIKDIVLTSNEFFEELVFEGDIALVKNKLENIKKGLADDHEIVYRWLDKDLKPVWVKTKAKVIKNLAKPWCIICEVKLINK